MENYGLTSIMPLEIITYKKDYERSIIDLCLKIPGIIARMI
jgi:hypothetical protein